MVWGYAKGFVIERAERGGKRITCRDCLHYNKTDLSCREGSKYLPADGYDSWKYCPHFILSNRAYNYEEKRRLLEKKNPGKNMVQERRPSPVKKEVGEKEKSYTTSLRIGVPIKHVSLGYGKVISIDGKMISIEFLDRSIRKFSLEYCESKHLLKEVSYSEYSAAKS